ncbi:hypothetical protein LTR37_016386 [Vermiconidia calcicola]|uniref:Uncharacterized protein n=1 Tax=Vermiconidia calcicola TaxID=1690605 RepID=A0ACC3MN00_9PEZI|nr:hypothetical protein LTR37_016386 [Vermiconidia calcicola]
MFNVFEFPYRQAKQANNKHRLATDPLPLKSPEAKRFADSIEPPLTTVDELTLDSEDRREDDVFRDIHDNSIVTLRHEYLHSLILGERWARCRVDGTGREEVFCVSLPETIAAPGISVRAQRSLLEPFVFDTRRMAAVMDSEHVVAETAPSSPPDLSYSKSSKSSSSSVRSDSSDEATSKEQLSQHDDVRIDERDSIEDSNLKPESRPTLKRPPPRSKTMGDVGKRVISPPMREERYPSLKHAVNGVLRDQSLNLPQGRGMRRGFTSPSSPSFITHGGQKMSSRSPSPSKAHMQNGFTTPPQMLSSATPRLSADARSPTSLSSSGQFARRKSWQPGRKSVRELEAECDDVDEEVPDEAVLENVPISPLPGQFRMSPRCSRSATPSPQRRPSHPNLPRIPSHTSLHSANVPKNAKRPSAPTILPNGQYGSPRSPRQPGPPKSPRHPRPPMLHHSNTMPAFPGEPLSRKHRSKSWTEDLNEEAKQISAALEEFSDRLSTEKHGSGTNSVANSPPRPSFSKQRSKTAIMDLPDAQKGNVMIDPLPVSKEKEAVLSRTRPSWLPPKDQKEEKRHVKEWETMMARAAETEKKRLLKEREDHENNVELKGNLARIWEQHVLPDWDVIVREPKTRELWWRGVTARSRGVVWQKAIGNELGLSDSSFDAALQRANEVEDKVVEMSAEERNESKQAAWLDAIARDVQVACPELEDLDKRAPFQNSLRDVLKAYAMYRSDVGYVYGTHLVAGILCLHLRPVEAFVALANALNRPLPLAFLVHDVGGMARSYDLVLSTLKYKFTKLHDHLTCTATGLKPEEYLEPMFRCLFAYHLPATHVSRIWDIFVFEGDKALVRAAVAVLGKLEGSLYCSRDEILDILSWRNEKAWDVGSEEEFMKAVREAGKVDSKADIRTVYV